jgi:copper chaperone CopZ
MKRFTTVVLLMLTFAMPAHSATIELTVNGLVCGFCAQGIEKTFRKNPATEDIYVSLENRLVAIATRTGADIPDDELRKSLKDAGYDVKAINRTERSLSSLRQLPKSSK